jgi:polar amino acid transport system substrate-binding protein
LKLIINLDTTAETLDLDVSLLLKQPDAAELLRSGKADVFGADSGVGYPAAEALPGAKIVPGAFAMVHVAAAVPKGRSAAAQTVLATVLDEAKQTGVVQKAIDARGLKGVKVATK